MASSAFVNAMNAPALTKHGVKGSDVYTEEGVGDLRVSLFQKLVRGLDVAEIRRVVHQAFQRPGASVEFLVDFAVMAFQTRDIRGGKGERDCAYIMLLAIFEEKPEWTEPLLRLVPEYGCWRDMWVLWEWSKSDYVKDAILNVVKWHFFEDLSRLPREGEKPKVKLSLLGKWLPREGSTHDELAKVFSAAFFPDIPEEADRLRAYRKACSSLAQALAVIEQKMCDKSGKWTEILPGSVPGRLMTKCRKAFLNEVCDRGRRKGKHQEGKNVIPAARFPDSEDRQACRQNFLAHLAKVLEGKETVKGANMVYPHEIVEKFFGRCRNTITSDEEALLQAQWNSIRDAAKAQGGLRGIVPMSDFSGSMSGIPMEVSMALGILLSEINHPAFADYLLGFDSIPSWISFKGMETLKEKVEHARRYAKGLSTDFQAACDLILRRLVENSVPRDEAPKDLLVLTDMGFDAACGVGQAGYYTGNYYTHNVKTAGWQTQLQIIRSNFAAAGYEAPRIVIWNLRAEYKDFHAKADEDGVVVLSGWSPAVLKAIQKGGVEVRTPYQGLRELLDDARYDRVRQSVAMATPA